MNKQLITTTTQQDGTETVNARELHSFLESKTQFTIWITRKIEEIGFEENDDYLVIIKNDYNPDGGRSSHEYHISLDMAKELSMLERNDKGREARKYFIKVEKEFKNQVAKPLSIEELLRQSNLMIEYIKTERDGAIRTKAMIGDKKTATAMVTASHLSRENNKLKVQVDESTKFATVKSMIMKGHDVTVQAWRKLKKEMKKQMELTGKPESHYRKDIFDANYGTVKSWSAELWSTCFDISITTKI